MAKTIGLIDPMEDLCHDNDMDNSDPPYREQKSMDMMFVYSEENSVSIRNCGIDASIVLMDTRSMQRC
ncbi:hypothetical protein J6590_074637 [Homalodisca vitripennis]|nr:hypothetical protein J6590_074637 [Homalodisca vitripennis]